MSYLIRRLRSLRLRSALEEQRDFYATSRRPDEIRAWQLKQLNQLWTTISRRIPFYAALTREGKAPQHFQSWEEFREVMPITDRAVVQRHGAKLIDHSRSADFLRTTGGSTSEPVQLPAWHSELAHGNKDVWLARSWFDIDPSDKLFLIWGHSHQLGRALRGKFNALRREAKDSLLGYHRWSAYDLSEDAMRRAGEALLKFRPAWLVAYSVALDHFAQVNTCWAREFRALNLKAAIATAEAFPRADSARRIVDAIGCPVAMEYGAVESGPIAHQRPDGRFQIFWRHWFIEGVPSAQMPGAFEIFITSLYSRCFPLVRYRIGDLISEDPDAPQFAQTFSRVIGRCNDYIALSDGASIHSEAFTHAVKECETVARFQVVQMANGKIYFRYVPAADGATDESEIRRRLELIHPALRDIEVQKVASLPQTIAGKTRTIEREELHARG
jgi:phenylacetate-CoA ligase